MTLTDIPFPDISYMPKLVIGLLMCFGIFILPLVCWGLLMFTIIRFALFRPRPYSVIAFFGCIALAGIVACGPWYWNYSLQVLIAMSLTALVVLGEVLIRGLTQHYATAAGTVGISFVYYFLLITAVAVAAV